MKKEEIVSAVKIASNILLRNVLLAGCSAGLYVVAFPPFQWWPLAWVALAPFFWGIERATSGAAFFTGWFFGAVCSIGMAHWIFHALHVNGNAGIFVSLVFMVVVVGGLAGLYLGAFALVVSRLMAVWPVGIVRLFSIASLWVLMEYGRSHLFSGFPWGLLGHSQYKWLTLIQIADLTGVYGISFLLVLGNLLVTEVLRHRRNSMKPFFMAMPVFLVVLALCYGAVRIQQVGSAAAQASGAKTVAVVQASIEQRLKWKQTNQKQIIGRYAAITEKALREGARLIVWPETVVATYLQNRIPAEISRLLEKYAATMVLGGPRYTGTPRNYTFYNAAYQVDRRGIISVYDKVHLLPFGEYFPLGFVDVLRSRYAGPREYSSGKENTLFLSQEGNFGVLICFEVIFPQRVRPFVKKGADFLVTISNDAWFGRTGAAHGQHFSIAVFRAVEFRRQLVRASNTGISGFIEPTGEISAAIPPFAEGYRIAPAGRGTGETVYCRYGDWFVFFCAVWTGAVLIRRKGR